MLRFLSELLRKPTMVRALLVLEEKGPMTLSALSRELGTNKARLKKYMQVLVTKGLVVEELCCGVRVYKLKKRLEL